MNLLELSFNSLHNKLGKKHTWGTRGWESDLNSLSISEILEMLGDGNCAYTGKPFTDIHDATFERINPKLGYVKGNVVMVSRVANQSKSSLDCFVKGEIIPDAVKVKLLRKAIYQLEKGMK